MLKDFIDTIKDKNTIWVMENRDNGDRIFSKFVTPKLFSSTYVIVSCEVAYIFVHKLDEGNVGQLDKKYCKVFVYTTGQELKDNIASVLKTLNYPKKMLVSYSTMSDENTDIITHSSYLRMTRIFRGIYRDAGKKVKVRSAEMNIYNILSKNSNETIDRLRKLASITDEILKQSFESIKEGQMELDIAYSTKKIMKKVMDENMKKLGVVSYDFAWDICPIVLVGKNLEKGGHASPSSTKIKRGDTVYYDFGVKAVFEDGEILYTDMQRMGYLLKEGETVAPKKVQKVFDTLVHSISSGISAMKPGVRGYKVDEIVRGEIREAYDRDYPHATGHPVGHEVHGAGALISMKGSKRAHLKLIETGVYTLEPRIDIPNGGSIEEMIEVTQNGGIPLCKLQTEIYLIK